MKIRSLPILLSSILSGGFAFAQQTPQSLADAELPSLLMIYKDFHTHPELSTHEERSAAIVAKELKAAGCEVTEHVGKYDKPGLTCFGVVGVMKNGVGPTVLVRSDLDALPVHEETGLPYASTVTTKNDEGKRSASDACVRTRHSYVHTGRHGARTRQTQGRMARHDHFHRATG
jgi:hippurate hydrolase